MNGSDENVLHIAELVSLSLNFILVPDLNLLNIIRFGRVPLVPAQMTQKP